MLSHHFSLRVYPSRIFAPCSLLSASFPHLRIYFTAWDKCEDIPDVLLDIWYINVTSRYRPFTPGRLEPELPVEDEHRASEGKRSGLSAA